MRPLTDEETKALFEKLSKYIGENIKLLIDRPDGQYCFRFHRDRVYYVSEALMKRAANISRNHLISFGTCFGKFTKTQKFRLHITALDFLSPYAKYKVWVKPGAEQSYLYGNHVAKSGLGRITENTPQYQGVVVYSMNDVPLGFGVAAKSTQDCRRTDPMNIVVFHQADVGEYIRSEDTLT
ncbi:60S ribosome subunit biogenesis protein NIP7 homolog [Ptychodera flava]|uniref:60S ribosome subunit biogenesis protein NIP7 homolog n=1 Tax=Ptychodera flava TaxID=63121 RepID=UPI00396A1F4B